VAEELHAQLGWAEEDAELLRAGQSMELLARPAQAHNVGEVKTLQDHEQHLGR